MVSVGENGPFLKHRVHSDNRLKTVHAQPGSINDVTAAHPKSTLSLQISLHPAPPYTLQTQYHDPPLLISDPWQKQKGFPFKVPTLNVIIIIALFWLGRECGGYSLEMSILSLGMVGKKRDVGQYLGKKAVPESAKLAKKVG